MAVHVILTGGTIDSYFKGFVDTVVPKKHSTIPGYLKNLRLYGSFVFTEVCMKDSRELTTKDLQKICRTIDKSKHKKILITHGTYTMPKTAKYLEKNLKTKDKTIIITGSMIPLEGFSPSDASFNLGFSLAKLQETQHGIYVCMNGKLFLPKELHIPQTKVAFIKEGRFTTIK